MKRLWISLLLLLFVFIAPAYTAEEVDVVSLSIGIENSVVSVGTSATAVPTTALAGRRVIIIQNLTASKVVYVGASDVTADEVAATGGFQLANQYDTLVMDATDDIIVYCRVASTTASVAVLELQ